MGVGSASVVDYANTYPGTASHVNATGSVGDFEVVVDGSGATTLSLNFQTATSLDPRITFSRTSNATLVGSDGLIQYAPHNLLTYSEQFGNAAWSKIRATITANAAASPDGTTTADKLVEDTTSTSTHYVVQSFTQGAAATTYNYSVYLKKDTRGFGYVRVVSSTFAGGGDAYFDLNNGTVGTSSANSASISAVGNGWYRCSINITTTTETAQRAEIYVAQSGATLVYTGDGTSGIYIWGAQLNEGALQPYYSTTSIAYYGPRFDYDPETLAPKGLLIEEQRTNLLTYSSEFENAAWAKTNATVTANALNAPDGTSNADLITCSAAANNIVQVITTAILIGDSYTSSVYLKGAGSDIGKDVWLVVRRAGAGTLEQVAIKHTLTNSWVRVTASLTFTAVQTGVSLDIRTDISGGTRASSFYAWGAQMEKGSFATSYIPTTSATVTRAADNASMVGSNFSSWYNQSEGTFGVNGDTVSNSGNRVYFDVGANGALGTTAYTVQTSTYVGLLPGTAPVNMTSTVNTTTLTTKIATAMQNNNSIIAVNASLGVVDTACTMPASATTLTVGCSQFGGTFGNYLNGHIQSIKYYPTRLPNGTLQGLTA